MDDKTYRRVFTETRHQTSMRHNGIVASYAYRRCRGCEGTGRVLDEFRLATDKKHPTCDGTGLVEYRRTR